MSNLLPDDGLLCDKDGIAGEGKIPEDIEKIIRNLDDMRRWARKDPTKTVEHGNKYPYDGSEGVNHIAHPNDWTYRAARAVIWDLSDRRGIKHGFDNVDWDVRCEIVSALAAIIEAAHSETV